MMRPLREGHYTVIDGAIERGLLLKIESSLTDESQSA